MIDRKTYETETVPDLGEGPGGPGPRPRTNRGLPPNPSIFRLMIDVSVVILIEDFEINEKLCKLAVRFHSLVNFCIRRSRI